MKNLTEYFNKIVSLTSDERAFKENAFTSTSMIKGELWVKQGKICDQIAYVVHGKLRSYDVDEVFNSFKFSFKVVIYFVLNFFIHACS